MLEKQSFSLPFYVLHMYPRTVLCNEPHCSLGYSQFPFPISLILHLLWLLQHHQSLEPIHHLLGSLSLCLLCTGSSLERLQLTMPKTQLGNLKGSNLSLNAVKIPSKFNKVLVYVLTAKTSILHYQNM